MTNMILAAQAQGGGSGLSMIIMMVAIFAIMWFFMIHPQQKRQKAIQKFQASLTEGTPGGGIYGTVKSIDMAKNTVEVKIARDVVITVDRGYVFQDVSSTPMTK